MIFILIGFAIVAAFVANGSPVGGVAIVNAVAAVWSNGVMANYPGDPDSIPNIAARVSMLTALLTVVFFVVGLAT